MRSPQICLLAEHHTSLSQSPHLQPSNHPCGLLQALGVSAQCNSPSTHHPACICAWDCPDQGAAPCTWPHWTPLAHLSRSFWTASLPSLGHQSCLNQQASTNAFTLAKQCHLRECILHQTHKTDVIFQHRAIYCTKTSLDSKDQSIFLILKCPKIMSFPHKIEAISTQESH